MSHPTLTIRSPGNTRKFQLKMLKWISSYQIQYHCTKMQSLPITYYYTYNSSYIKNMNFTSITQILLLLTRVPFRIVQLGRLTVVWLAYQISRFSKRYIFHANVCRDEFSQCARFVYINALNARKLTFLRHSIVWIICCTRLSK